MRELGAIEQRIKDDATAALKAGDRRRREALNQFVAALKKERIDSRKEPTEADELVVLKRERKRRAEALELYEQAGRDDLADQERFEAELLAGYMPEELSADELAAMVDEAIAATGAASPKEMGKVMAQLMPRVAGRADGKALERPRAEQAGRLSVADHARTVIDLDSNSDALALAGEHDAHLKILEQRLSCALTMRGNVLTLEGDGDACVKAKAAIDELLTVIKSGRPLSPAMVESLMDIAVNAVGKPSEVYGDVVWTHRGRQIGPRTVNQKLYVDAMRRNTITFAIGPAGTGKTYLATAMAVSAFFAKSVGRIILTRPAVEAGESLGFLPGTVSEKVDPYFRPLFDALYDMIDGEKLAALQEKGEIEVAPLAFMRGRT